MEVYPKGELIEDELFETPEGFEDALYGAYSAMGHSFMFGRNMNLIPDVMAQYYNTGNTLKPFNDLDLQNTENITSYLRQMWEESYKVIGYLNNIIAHGEEYGEPEKVKLVVGEAYGLRAFLHFNLLVLYAVDIRSTDAGKRAEAIPYVEKYQTQITPFSSVEEVYEKLISDLETAESFLLDDETLMDNYPRIGFEAGEQVDFTASREIHFNLYAVWAAMARIAWMKGDLDKALVYAEKVITSGKFDLVNTPREFEELVAGRISPVENIWGLYAELNNLRWNTFRNPSTGVTVRQNEYQNYVSKDLRSDNWFGVDGEFILLDKMVHFGLAEGEDVEISYPNLGLSMFRLPEMLLIAAESLLSSDKAKAGEYFDRLLVSRGETPFSEYDPVKELTIEDIRLEYRKEFIGEGIEWCSMKRENREIQLPEGPVSGDNVYTLPIPIEESEYR